MHDENFNFEKIGMLQDGASPRTGKVEGAVEVHDPEAWGFFSWKR
jgi:hypothetical protein